MEFRFGEYGYIDNHLLPLEKSQNGYEFCAYNDELIIKKYNFKETRSPYSGYISYRLKAKENAGISAYQVRTCCFFNGYKFFIENFSNGVYYTRPLEEAMKHFKDYPRHGYDPMYEFTEDEVSDIWEERTPIEGFKFDVEPIHYIKKDGKYLE